MNPKDVQGRKKPPLQLIPGPAAVLVAMALKDGADKYGAFNWRGDAISAMEYVGATKRHIDSWTDGEDKDPKSLNHHLAHAAATLLIMLDAQNCYQLEDDRPMKAGTASLIRDLTVESDSPATPVGDMSIRRASSEALQAELHKRGVWLPCR